MRLIFKLGILAAFIAIFIGCGISCYHSLAYIAKHCSNHTALLSISYLGLILIGYWIYYILSQISWFFLGDRHLFEEYGHGSVLITGATDGIGFEYSRIFAQQGFKVIMHGRNSDKLDEKVAAIQQEIPRANIEKLIIDLSIPLSDSAKNSIKEKCKFLSILINNAGVGNVGCLGEQNPLEIKKILNVNSLAPLELMHLLIPQFDIKRGKCGVLNVSSLASYGLLPRISIYSASKAFLSNLTRCLSIDYPQYQFLNLCPGPIYTQIFRNKQDPFCISAEYAARCHLRFFGRKLETLGCISHWVRMHVQWVCPERFRAKLAQFLISGISSTSKS